MVVLNEEHSSQKGMAIGFIFVFFNIFIFLFGILFLLFDLIFVFVFNSLHACIVLIINH